jgi:DNA-binding response OmpR family regulator
VSEYAVHILIVEDDDEIASVVGDYLKREGYTVERAANGLRGLEQARAASWSLILLDVMLPGLDGLEVCRRLRAEHIDVPIIFLTARGEETDQVLGLGMGGDDYVLKPFSPAALVARVKAQLRRYHMQRDSSAPDSEVLHFPGLDIDVAGAEVKRRGKRVPLTATEFELLRFLASHPGRVFTRDQLFREIWREDYPGDGSTVMVHLHRLREKVEDDPSAPRYIVTVRGLGYRFNAAGDARVGGVIGSDP